MTKPFVGSFVQGSRETLDYSLNWVPAVGNDAIVVSEWFGESGSPVIGDGSNGGSTPTVADGVSTCWVVGGTVGDVYHLSNVVTTAGGRKYEASIKVKIIDK